MAKNEKGGGVEGVAVGGGAVAGAAAGGGAAAAPTVEKETLRGALSRCLPTAREGLTTALETLKEEGQQDTWPDDILLEAKAVKEALESSPVLTVDAQALASALAKAAVAPADADADAKKDAGGENAAENADDAKNAGDDDADADAEAKATTSEKPAASPRVRASDVLPGGACGASLLESGAVSAAAAPREFVTELLERFDASARGEKGRFAKRDVWDLVRVVYYRLDGQMFCERLPVES
uniref:Uncharacterized protein n=1 Tax=Lotharella oceanica TaxID=641309 RepID=A0A7S2TX30_9EUKA